MGYHPKRTYMLEHMHHMLERGETLDTCFYGTIEKLGRESQCLSCYIGIAGAGAKKTLLFAALHLLDPSASRWGARRPLCVESLRVRKSLLPGQRIVGIRFRDDRKDFIRIRMADRVPGDIGNQQFELDRFLEILSGLVVERL